MTIGVYGLVAGIVKLDDLGVYLTAAKGPKIFSSFKRSLGRAVLLLAPRLMRLISFLGMVAMFIVGGGIIVHGIHALQLIAESTANSIAYMFGGQAFVRAIIELAFNATAGLVCGGITFLFVIVFSKIHKNIRLKLRGST